MEDKYKELLELHRSKFSLVVDVERLFPILESAEVLVKEDIDEVGKQTTGPAKVDKLLDILIAKENLAFKSLCYALESTYPHLLTVMFLGNNNRVGNPGKSTPTSMLNSIERLKCPRNCKLDALSTGRSGLPLV